MNDENLHITPDPHKGIPEPEIPADEAWNNMAAILDVELTVSPPDSVPSQKPPSSGGWGIIGGGIQFWSIGLIVLGVAGLVTWGVLRYTNKPETSVIKKDTINLTRNASVTDTLNTTNQKKPALTGNIKFPTAVATHDIKMDLPIKPSKRDNTVQSKATSQSTNISRNEKYPISSVTTVSKPSEPKTKDIVPSQTGIDNTTNVVNNNSNQQLVIKEKSIETVKNEEVQPTLSSPDTASVESSDNTVPAVNPAINPVADMKADNTQNNAGSQKYKNSLSMSENLSWQLGVSGSIGEVVQKGRNPNLYYGAMVTGGLWHKKLKAGIETGLGWSVCNDYGSVLSNVRITDSIPGDTVHPVTHIDTTRISSSKYLYQYLQIPLFISKQIVGKGKFVFDIKTGPVIGILISQKQISSSTSGPDNGEILSTVNSDYTRLKISWEWNLMLQLRWNFNDRLSFTLSPSAIFYLNNLYDRNNRPVGMPIGIGVNAGLIYKFK
ncbi:MAG: hypothetical protein WCI71_10450 [Bacteroidota bacterium]